MQASELQPGDLMLKLYFGGFLHNVIVLGQALHHAPNAKENFVHAAIHIGNGRIAESIGEGITVTQLMNQGHPYEYNVYRYGAGRSRITRRRVPTANTHWAAPSGPPRRTSARSPTTRAARTCGARAANPASAQPTAPSSWWPPTRRRGPPPGRRRCRSASHRHAPRRSCCTTR